MKDHKSAGIIAESQEDVIFTLFLDIQIWQLNQIYGSQDKEQDLWLTYVEEFQEAFYMYVCGYAWYVWQSVEGQWILLPSVADDQYC